MKHFIILWVRKEHFISIRVNNLQFFQTKENSLDPSTNSFRQEANSLDQPQIPPTKINYQSKIENKFPGKPDKKSKNASVKQVEFVFNVNS